MRGWRLMAVLLMALVPVPAVAQERWSAWSFSSVDSFLRWRWIGHRYGPDILPNCEFEFRDEYPGTRLLNFNYRVSYRTSRNAFADRVGYQYVSSQSAPVGDSINDCTSISIIWFEDFREVTGPAPRPGAAPSTDTYFIDLDDVFTSQGEYRYQGFTIDQNTTFDLRFAADVAAAAAIIPASEFSSFTRGGSFRGYGIFDNTYGTKTSLTLPPGTYYAAVRNQAAGRNTVRFEVDTRLRVPGARFYDWYFSGHEMVKPNGGKVWQQFTVADGARLFIDGCNSGVEAYIIPNSEIANFQSSQSFRYYTAYSGTSRALPGQWEVDLPAGTYWLVFRNLDSSAHAVTWQAERWVAAPTAMATEAGVPQSTSRRPAVWLDSHGDIRLTFDEALRWTADATERLRVHIDGVIAPPSEARYDEAAGVLILSVPNLRSARGRPFVSWRDLPAASGRLLSGNSDPIAVPRDAEAVGDLGIASGR